MFSVCEILAVKKSLILLFCYRFFPYFILLSSFEAVAARTELQQAQVEGVSASWNNIAATMMERQLMPIERALFDRLDEVLQTAMGMSANGVGLDLSADDIDAGLQQVAGEEVATFRSTLTDSSYSQMNNIIPRFTQLRGGAVGLTLAGMGFNADIPGLMPATGGGASADELSGFGRLSGFLNIAGSTGDVEGTDRENGYDFDSYGVTAGVDYRISTSFVLGIAAGYSDLDSRYHREATVSGGDVQVDGYNYSLYGTFYKGDFYIDGVVSYGGNDYDMDRRILIPLGAGSTANQSDWDLTANGKTDSRQRGLSIGMGYEVGIGATTISPYLRLNYLDSEVEGYQETGAGPLEYIIEGYDVDSLVGVLGLSGTKAINTNFGVLIPQARIAWAHEHQNDTKTLNYRYAWEAVPVGGSPWIFPIQSEQPDREYFVFGIGGSGVFRGGTQLFVDYQTLLGHRRVTERVFTVGLRVEL